MRTSGEIQWVGPSGTLVRDTQTCTHCSTTWIIDPTGPERAFCRKCYGPVCGREGCVTQCLHREKEMEQVERGTRNGDAVPIRCAHCHVAWQTMPGSGIERGWCLACNGHLCGNRECFTHPDRKADFRWMFEQLEPISRM